MRYEIIDCRYNAEEKQAWMGIKTKYGTFTGTCKAHPEDYDIASEFTGCEIAERKAYIKALKAHCRFVSAEIKTLEDLHKRLMCCKDFDYNSFEARQIRKVTYEKKEELSSYKNIIEGYKAGIENYLQTRRAKIEKMRKIQESKDKRG